MLRDDRARLENVPQWREVTIGKAAQRSTKRPTKSQTLERWDKAGPTNLASSPTAERHAPFRVAANDRDRILASSPGSSPVNPRGNLALLEGSSTEVSEVRACVRVRDQNSLSIVLCLSITQCLDRVSACMSRVLASRCHTLWLCLFHARCLLVCLSMSRDS